jgi:hypothetical protein
MSKVTNKKKNGNSKQIIDKTDFNESAELHKGQKYISTKTDP